MGDSLYDSRGLRFRLANAESQCADTVYAGRRCRNRAGDLRQGLVDEGCWSVASMWGCRFAMRPRREAGGPDAFVQPPAGLASNYRLDSKHDAHASGLLFRQTTRQASVRRPQSLWWSLSAHGTRVSATRVGGEPSTRLAALAFHNSTLGGKAMAGTTKLTEEQKEEIRKRVLEVLNPSQEAMGTTPHASNVEWECSIESSDRGVIVKCSIKGSF